jgi:hypothetical protein
MRVTNGNEIITVGVCKNNEMPNYSSKDGAFNGTAKIDGKEIRVVAKPGANAESFYMFKLGGKALYVKGSAILNGDFTTVTKRERKAKAEKVETPAAPPQKTREELKAMKGSDLEAFTGLKLNGQSKDKLIDKFFAKNA